MRESRTSGSVGGRAGNRSVYPTYYAMPQLELRVPPPVIAAAVAAAMWLVSTTTPLLSASAPLRVVLAVTLALVGGSFSLAGVVSFRRAKTTVNPMKPENTTALVTSGVYTVTRNPMYVGLAFVLVAWAVYLLSPVALAGPLAFVLYITRYQISPEERALSTMFGSEYASYKSKVRRWL